MKGLSMNTRMCMCVAVSFQIAAIGALAPAGNAQNCSQPPGAVRVNDSYQPSGSGDWWRVTNWSDTDGNGFINALDQFNFCDGAGAMMELPGPTVMKLTANDETWYYFTGTGADGSGLGNFHIYRTQDFTTFELYMKAFDRWETGSGPPDQYTDSNAQYPNDPALYLNGKWFRKLVNPQLFVDPTQAPGPDRWIYLSFTAAQNSTDTLQDCSVFLTRISQANFLAWENQPDKYGNVSEPRFADSRYGQNYSWYHYRVGGGPAMYDGGWSMGHRVPCSGRPDALKGTGAGQLWEQEHGWAHNLVGPGEFMERDAFEFFDPELNAGDPWKRVMFYVWKYENSASPAAPGFSADPLDFGFHISAHPMETNIEFNENYATIVTASNRSSFYRMTFDGVPYDNGMVVQDDPAITGTYGHHMNWGGVAESPSVLYLPETDRYYLFYSRNAYGAAAYQLVYRMTEPGAPLSSLAMTWGDRTVPEYLLLRMNNAFQFRHANAGAAEAFMITDSSGVDHPYIATGLKLDADPSDPEPGQYTNHRTLFIKELTVANASTGVLVQLREAHDDPVGSLTSAQAAKDMRFFRIPRCRE